MSVWQKLWRKGDQQKDEDKEVGSVVYSINSQECWFVDFESPWSNEKHDDY